MFVCHAPRVIAGSVSFRSRWVVALLLVLLAGLAAWGWHAWRRNKLVVYCAHDAIFADGVLRAFEKQTGIKVAVRYDTEATKSLGLIELLVREAAAPRCDVFWNNEVLGTVDLQRRGLLEAYRGTGFARIPSAFKDSGGYWAGFAARLRVIIRRAGEKPAGLETQPPHLPVGLHRWAIAKPLYGTTLTHYAALWQIMGSEQLISWHRRWREGGGREVNGNSAVKDAVARGVCDFGFTDTDDFFSAKDEHAAVEIEPARLPNGKTICIPNTVAVLRGARHQGAARQLVDFLLSAETELALARSKSRQIPLGAFEEADVPAEVRALRAWAADSIAVSELSAAREECLAWLKSESLR